MTERDSSSPLTLSVVMPSLNQAEFLRESVTSVLLQRPAVEELIVADGGSTDGTRSVLAELVASFPGRMQWWSSSDSGPAEAVNEAVRLSRGTVIGWLNSDDIYTPGAPGRALDLLSRRQDFVMVYGHAEHIDASGNSLSAYPSLPPSTVADGFADGCFICQPSVYIRREAWLETGGLDTRLLASFDFDFWWRLFRAYPGRIGFVEAVQAKSRLHGKSITSRQRERVAMEGLQVVHRHTGGAPAHWLLTHFDEIWAEHPFRALGHSIPEAQMASLVEAAKPWLTRDAALELEERLRSDARLRLSSANVYVGVYPDGWAPAILEIRIRQVERTILGLRLDCTHSGAVGSVLRLSVSGPEGALGKLVIERPGTFEIFLPAGTATCGAEIILFVECHDMFVPAELEAGSSDRRALAFTVNHCQVSEAALTLTSTFTETL